MSFYKGYFLDPSNHHEGWFRAFRFNGGIEIWFGHTYYYISWR